MPCWDCSPEPPKPACAPSDVVGRIGGEEFVAIISGTLAEACIAAERVRSAFERAAVAPGSPQIPATVSIGVACGMPDVSIDVLIARADAVLYRAKANGRNRVEPDETMVVERRGAPARLSVADEAFRHARDVHADGSDSGAVTRRAHRCQIDKLRQKKRAPQRP